MRLMYLLNEDGEFYEEEDPIRWAEGIERCRIVKKDQVNGRQVSTVFLGINHNFTAHGDPVLWETMVFSGEDAAYLTRRYTSQADALNGHDEIVDQVRSLLPKEIKPEPVKPGRFLQWLRRV